MKIYEQRVHENDKDDVFDYYDVYRLTNLKYNSPNPTIFDTTQFEKSKTYQFDKVDNIREIIESQNQTVNEITTTMEGDNAKLNQYTIFDQWGLDYDLNGNMSQKGGQRFYYDYRNQLVRVVEGATNTNLKYDALGRRIEKSNGSNTVKYYYDGNQVIEERDDSDQIKRQLIYGNGIDELLIIVNYDGVTAIPYYAHNNEIGSTIAITNQDGDVVERVSYDTFGMPTFTDYLTDPQNPTIVSNSVIGNDILFQGRRYDKETNLLYLRTRYFDPIMGRFLQTDPMGYEDSMNLYQAFNQNPVNFVDPMGEQNINPKNPFYWFTYAFRKAFGQNIEGKVKTSIKKLHKTSVSIAEWTDVGDADTVLQWGTGYSVLHMEKRTPSKLDKTSVVIGALTPVVGKKFVKTVLKGGKKFLGKAWDFFGKIFRRKWVEVSIEGVIHKVPRLRGEYINKVLALKDKAKGLKDLGLSKKEIAEILNNERRELGKIYKDLTPKDKLEKIFERNIKKYGDKYGPTVEWFLDQGYTYDDIIEKASKPGGRDLEFLWK